MALKLLPHITTAFITNSSSFLGSTDFELVESIKFGARTIFKLIANDTIKNN
ncbi:MAG: hypothetical protein M3Q77_01165 [Thermoproteota archaeon]|nr:hypothetical protein [Thermoproteota archaeon]